MRGKISLRTAGFVEFFNCSIDSARRHVQEMKKYITKHPNLGDSMALQNRNLWPGCTVFRAIGVHLRITTPTGRTGAKISNPSRCGQCFVDAAPQAENWVYGFCICETLPVRVADKRMLEVYNNGSIHRILHVRRRGCVPVAELRRHLRLTSIPTLLVQRRFRWIGHAARRPEGELIKDPLLPTPPRMWRR